MPPKRKRAQAPKKAKQQEAPEPDVTEEPSNQEAEAADEIQTESVAQTSEIPEPELTQKAPAAQQEPDGTPEAPKAPTDGDAAAKAKERLERFKALQARAKSSSEKNFKAATLESQRLATDTTQLAGLAKKRELASQKLQKADLEDAGEDFERKRAWDWTVDESERWDKRVKKRAAHRDNNAFQDYAQESNKVYKRSLKHVPPDMERYEREKMAAIEKAAASGGLDIVETEDGELIAVDKDGSFYSTADSLNFAQNRPDKAAVDRLVADLRAAEEQRLKKSKERRAQNGDDGDVTYINEKNKQFNQKLARFYNKYTAEIRDSFERGTMI